MWNIFVTGAQRKPSRRLPERLPRRRSGQFFQHERFGWSIV
jgi:hypothetical protein